MNKPTTTPFLTGSVSEITLLIQRYKLGDSTAAEELLTKFNKYMRKWKNLLCFGKWNSKDSDIKFFLAALGSLDIHNTCQIIYTRLKSYEKEDIEQEITLALLETALRYGNIHKYFKYTLLHRVSALIRDPLTRSFLTEIPVLESGREIDHYIEIDSAWVEGKTCGIGFDELTCIEREILRLTKYYGYTVNETSEMLGIPISTIERAIRRAKVVLKVHYLES
jgi:hypothetical protein